MGRVHPVWSLYPVGFAPGLAWSARRHPRFVWKRYCLAKLVYHRRGRCFKDLSSVTLGLSGSRGYLALEKYEIRKVQLGR